MSQPYTSYQADAFGAANGVVAVSQSPWAEFFGQPRFTGNQSAYDVARRDTWTLPEAYAGQSVKMAQETEFMVYSDENFYTTRVMPMQIVAHANGVNWNVTEYANQMPTLVPELGVSRLLSSTKRSNSASFDRRGLSFFMEHGFMHTVEGRQHYVNTLKQLALSIIEFAKFDVIYTLLTSQHANLEWEKKFSVYKGKRLAELFANQIWMWACLQKFKNGATLLDTKISSWMERYKGLADTWIFAPQVQAYLQTVPSERIDYYKAGPAGPQRLIDGVRALTKIGTADAFFARSYDIDADGPKDILGAPAQIGEYAEMRDRERDTNYERYASKNRHVRIYDEDADGWFECKLQWALDECRRFDAKSGAVLEMSALYQPMIEGLGADARRDVFSFFNADAQRFEPVRLFGQMEEEYFPAADKLSLARTALAAARREWASANSATFDQAYQQGLALVDEIDASTDVTPLGPNTFLGAEYTAAAAPTTIPGGYQSYAGIKAIAAAKIDPADASSDFVKKSKVAADFVKAIDSLTSKLGVYFPGSYVLDPKFASPWWSENGRVATAGDVFFENAIARARVPLFETTGTLAKPDKDAAKASKTAFESAYKAYLARARTRQDKTSSGPIALPETLAAVDPSKYPLALAAAVLLSSVGVVADDTPRSKALFDNVYASILSKIVIPKFEGVVSRDQLIEHVLEENPTAFRRDTLTQKIRGAFANITGDPENEGANIATADPKRTTLLAGHAFMKKLYKDVRANKPLAFVPASPADPERPMSLAELRRAAAADALNDDRMADEYADADAPASSLAPAFAGQIASELSTQVAHLALLRTAGSGASTTASIGAAYDDGGDEYMGVRPRLERRRADGALSEAASAPMQRAWEKVRRLAGGDRLLAAVAHTYDFTPVRKIAFERMIANNIVLPLAFIIARPHATYNMLTAIKCLSGERMGAYLQQPGRFEVGDDVDVQAHIASYTYKSKAVVYDPKHVFVARNVFANGCLGGMGSRTFTERYAAGAEHTGRESIFVLAVPYASHEANGAPISLTGQAEVNGQGFSIARTNTVDYIGVEYYNARWGWRQALRGDETASFGALDGVSERTNINVLMFRGTAFYFDPQTQQFTELEHPNGHWPTAYVGCRNVRNGDLAEFDQARMRYENCTEA
jgi:hypothetical protein